ncbi:hypothetical protein [Halovenus salina]|uniref:Halobacterial output domain-containing protein n=2 Tax=Halovenus salina TaxID=1510225 RepID=A0ABD5W371_9EURY
MEELSESDETRSEETPVDNESGSEETPVDNESGSEETAEDREDNEDEDVLSGFDDDVSLGLKGSSYVRFSPKGERISPNSHLSQRHLRGYYAYTILYNESENELYLKTLTEEETNKLRAERPGVKIKEIDLEDKNSVSEMAIRELVRQFSIKDQFDDELSMRYYPDWDEERECVIVDLDEEPKKVGNRNNNSDSDDVESVDE